MDFSNMPNFQQFMQNINNNMPNQNINTNQMNMAFNQMMNNPTMLNSFMNNFNNMNNMGNNNFNNVNTGMANMNYQMMMNILNQMMMMNPMLFLFMLQNLGNNQNNQNNQNFQNNNNNECYINILFVVGSEYKITIQAKPYESLSSAITKFINKSGNTEINYYIFNGERLNESLTVGQQGLTDFCEVYVVNSRNIRGAD